MTRTQTLPRHLSGEYRVVRPLAGPDSRNEVLLVESLHTRQRHVLKLLHRSALADARFVRELGARNEGGQLHLPHRIGRSEDGRFLTLAEYLPDGSLHSCLTASNGLPGSAIRPLVRDLAAACRALHEETGGRRIVHGDIKPSNVLVLRRGEAGSDWAFRLADFDSSVLMDGGRYRGALAHGGTPGYAAPEALRGDAGPAPAMDYWSLGMVLLRALVGRHPFRGLTTHQQIRDMLVADEWRLDAGYLEPIRDEAGRALVAGLLRRVPAERWGEDEVRRWLAGDDPRIVVSGLRLLGENAADAPFSIDGEKIYTAGSLAVVLLRSWDTGALRSDALVHWLRGFNPTAADQIESAGQMDPDAGLLGFCTWYYPGERMPPVWRGEAISAPSLAGLAARAVAGDRPARAWLLDFFQQERHAHFASLSHYEEVAALVDSVRRTRREHCEAWSDVANAGGPNEAPDDDASWVQAVLIACSPIGAAERAAALSELFDPMLIMRRAEWFFVFGTDPDRISPSQLFVLRSLRESSLLDATNIEYLDDLRGLDTEALRAGLVLPATQRRLSDGLSVRPGGRVVYLASGDTYAPERTPGGDRRPASTGAGPSDPAHARPADEGPRLRMRLVRLAIRLPSPAAALTHPAAGEDEIHLAMVSWSGAGPNARLVLADPGPLPFATRLKVPVPAEGRLQLVLARSTRVYLTGPGVGRRERRRRSIQVLTGRRHPRIRPLVADLLPLRASLRALRDRVRNARRLRRPRARPRRRWRRPGRLIASVRSIRVAGTGPRRLSRALLRATARIHQVRVRKIDVERARRYTPGVEGRTRS